jgi:hypothetical protein
VKHLREALHRCVDLIVDAIEQDRRAPLAFKEPPAPPVVKRRRKSARMLPLPSQPVTPAGVARAAYILRQKGVIP